MCCSLRYPKTLGGGCRRESIALTTRVFNVGPPCTIWNSAKKTKESGTCFSSRARRRKSDTLTCNLLNEEATSMPAPNFLHMTILQGSPWSCQTVTRCRSYNTESLAVRFAGPIVEGRSISLLPSDHRTVPILTCSVRIPALHLFGN
jgi:hypothetical protein